MVKTKSETPLDELSPDLDADVSRVEADLEIMESHPGEMAEVETGIKESMKKRDREYKDSHFHSVPKGKKHQR